MRHILMIVCAAWSLAACGAPKEKPQSLDFQQTVIAQYLDDWFHLLGETQSVHDFTLRSGITRRGSVDGRPLSGSVFATTTVPASQNFLHVDWTASDAATGGRASGDLDIKNIAVRAVGLQGQALSAADQANGIQWDGEVLVQFALREDAGDRHDGAFSDYRLQHALQVKGGKVVTLPETSSPDGVHLLDTAMQKPLAAIDHAVQGTYRGSRLADNFVPDCGGGGLRDSGNGAGVSLPYLSIMWPPGRFHGAGTYSGSDVTPKLETRSIFPGDPLTDDISEIAAYRDVAVTMGPNLRSGTVQLSAVARVRRDYFSTQDQVVAYAGSWICPIPLEATPFEPRPA